MSDAGSDWSVDEQAIPEPSPEQLDALQRELETVRGALAAALLTTDDLRSRNQELAALIAEAGAPAEGESASRDSEALKCERAVELRWQLNDDLVVTGLGPRVGETPEVLMRGTIRTLSIAGLLDSDGLDALLPALRDGTWPRLQAVNMVGHGLTQAQAERACEVATQRGLALCTCPTTDLSWKLSGNPADVMLITTSLSSSHALTSTNLLGNNFDEATTKILVARARERRISLCGILPDVETADFTGRAAPARQSSNMSANHSCCCHCDSCFPV